MEADRSCDPARTTRGAPLNAFQLKFKRYRSMWGVNEGYIRAAGVALLVVLQVAHFGIFTLLWALLALFLWVSLTLASMYILYLSVIANLAVDVNEMTVKLEVDHDIDHGNIDARNDSKVDDAGAEGDGELLAEAFNTMLQPGLDRWTGMDELYVREVVKMSYESVAVIRVLVWCCLFVWSTAYFSRDDKYLDWDFTGVPAWMQPLDEIQLWMVMVDYAWNVMFEYNEIDDFLRMNALLDFCTFAPTWYALSFLGVASTEEYLLRYGFVRFVRLYGTMNLITQVLERGVSPVTVSILQIIIQMCSFLFSFAGLMFYLEAPTGDFVSYMDFIYFSVVTATTVGYGDFSPHKEASRLIATPFIILSSVYFFNMIDELREVMNKPRKFIGNMPGALDDSCLLVIGNLSPDQLKSFSEDFYGRTDTSAQTVKMMLLTSIPLEKFGFILDQDEVKKNPWISHIGVAFGTLVAGRVELLNENFLSKVGAVVVFSDAQSEPLRADMLALRTLFALRKLLPSMSNVFVQLNRVTHSKLAKHCLRDAPVPPQESSTSPLSDDLQALNFDNTNRTQRLIARAKTYRAKRGHGVSAMASAQGYRSHKGGTSSGADLDRVFCLMHTKMLLLGRSAGGTMGIITLITNLLDNNPVISSKLDRDENEPRWFHEYLSGFRNRVWNIPLSADIVMKMPSFGVLCRRLFGRGAFAIGIVRNHLMAQDMPDEGESHLSFAVSGRSQVFINPGSSFTLQPGDETIVLANMTAGLELAGLFFNTTSDKHRLQNFDVLLPDVISDLAPILNVHDSAESSKPPRLLKSSTKSSASNSDSSDPLLDSDMVANLSLLNTGYRRMESMHDKDSVLIHRYTGSGAPIVVLGWPANINSFLMAAKPTAERPVIVLNKCSDHLTSWMALSSFPHVFMVDGNPCDAIDLDRAGVKKAFSVVVLQSVSAELDGSETQVDEHNILASEAASMVCGGSLRTPIITEIHNQASAQYLDHFKWIPAADSLEGFYECCPVVTAGMCLAHGVLSGMLCESLFNPAFLTILTALLSGQQQLPKTKGQSSVATGFKLISVPVPERFFSHRSQNHAMPGLVCTPFSTIYAQMLAGGHLVIGVYRAAQQKDNNLPYVATCPDPMAEIYPNDKLFVIQRDTSSIS